MKISEFIRMMQMNSIANYATKPLNGEENGIV